MNFILPKNMRSLKVRLAGKVVDMFAAEFPVTIAGETREVTCFSRDAAGPFQSWKSVAAGRFKNGRVFHSTMINLYRNDNGTFRMSKRLAPITRSTHPGIICAWLDTVPPAELSKN